MDPERGCFQSVRLYITAKKSKSFLSSTAAFSAEPSEPVDAQLLQKVLEQNQQMLQIIMNMQHNRDMGTLAQGGRISFV